MAQKNLYMSWEESVSHAYERYGLVLENFRAGRYDEHRRMTDEFFHAAAEALDGMIRRDRRRENLRAELNTRRSSDRKPRTSGERPEGGPGKTADCPEDGPRTPGERFKG